MVSALQRPEHLITVRSLRNLVRFLVALQLLPALESGEETLVGGQAVLEGVMMRSPDVYKRQLKGCTSTFMAGAVPSEY